MTDVFGFTPVETATALDQPITAIKAALHRARKRQKEGGRQAISPVGEGR
ncbi:RNA polymerase sigma factor sigma-70 region 4 domain-containing protein [Paenibacillus cymbidii]